MWFLSFQQLVVAAFWRGRSVFPFRTILVQEPVPAPQTTGRLFAVCADVAKWLAVVALRESTLCSMCLHLGRWKISCDFAVFGKVTRKRGMFNVFGSLGRGPTVGRDLLDTDNVEAEAHQPIPNIVCRGVLWEVVFHRLYGPFGY
jgi:hypothetical protein